MKKSLHISFAVLYLILTTGFTLTYHYCGGEVSDVSIVRNIGDEAPCGCNGVMCATSCCKDEIIAVKIVDYHSPVHSQIISLVDYTSLVYPDFPSFQLSGNHEHIFHQYYILNSNPPPLYINNCAFLI